MIKKYTSILLAIVLILSFSNVFADGEKEIAVTLKSSGDSQAKKPSKDWFNLEFGTLLDDKDEIRTGDNGFTALIFTDDKSQVKIRENSRLTLRTEDNGKGTLNKRIIVYVGDLFVNATKQKGTMIINTPDGTASVKGTQFWILVGEDGLTTLVTLEGLVDLTSRVTGSTTSVAGGSAVTINPDGSMTNVPIENIPLPEEGAELESIQIEFRDADGNIKTLNIDLEQE